MFLIEANWFLIILIIHTLGVSLFFDFVSIMLKFPIKIAHSASQTGVDAFFIIPIHFI